jgi:hypothetical protein
LPYFPIYFLRFSNIFQYFPYVPIFSYVFLCFPMFSTRFWMILALTQVDLIPVDLGSRSNPATAAFPSERTRRRRDRRRGAGAAAACCGNACMATAEAGAVFWDHQDEDSWIYNYIYIWLYMYIILSYYHIVWQCHILFFLAHNMYLHKKVSGKEREVLVLVFRDPEHWQHANDRSAHWMMLNDKEKNRSSSISSLRGQTSLWLWHSQFAMDAMAHRNRWFTS